MNCVSEYRYIKILVKNKKTYLKKKKDLKRELRKWLKLRRHESKWKRRTGYKILKCRCNLIDLNEHRRRYLNRCRA
ncbi:TPA: hypothetical protein N2D99_002274 [Clostridium botulinum]|nr:hypothetical protein [Clostridium botulinum]